MSFVAPNVSPELVSEIKRVAMDHRKTFMAFTKIEALSSGSFFSGIPDMLIEKQVISGPR